MIYLTLCIRIHDINVSLYKQFCFNSVGHVSRYRQHPAI